MCSSAWATAELRQRGLCSIAPGGNSTEDLGETLGCGYAVYPSPSSIYNYMYGAFAELVASLTVEHTVSAVADKINLGG